ncbi:MAG TPA: hypothetical protein VFQ35_26635 [Polyangiaceae bacterium]|nr:hypothetical protein [Polyangiaceae bacterium]
MNFAKRFAAVTTLLLCTGCVYEKGKEKPCANAPTLEDRKNDARMAAGSEYVPPLTAACPELDPPVDGESDTPGLSELEYQALLRGANGNFFDDGTWWIKAMPRGGVHVSPLKIVGERCQEVTYDRFGYDYAFAKPAITAAPQCGHYLTGILAGHKFGDSWPAIFGVEASGLIRLAPLSPQLAFDAYLHAPRGLVGTSTEASGIDRVDVELHDGDSVEFAMLVSATTFTSALRVVLKAGDESRLAVGVDVYPRANFQAAPRIALGGLSGAYHEDAAHDFDRMEVTYSDGTTHEAKLDDGSLEWGNGDWARVPSFAGTAGVQSIGLLQSAAPGGGPRSPKMTISNIDSNVPIGFELALTSRQVLGGNVVGSLVLDLSEAGAFESPIHVSYLVTAAAP